MSTVGFITRDLTGTTRQSTFSEGSPSLLNVHSSKDISLNLSASDIDAYVRRGTDLHIVLADGQTLVLQNFYGNGTIGGKNLFLSEEGNFVEVILEDKAEGALFASYEPLDLSGKWSAYDDMVFLDVDRIEPVIAPLAAPVVGGLGGVGAAAGVAGAAAVIGSGGGGGGGGGNNTSGATVDNPDAIYQVAAATTDPVVITGTGTPGATVEIDLGGGVTGTSTVKDDGTWEVSFPAADMPADGNYDTTVKVTDPDGTEHNLDGPSVHIDTTPPEIEVTSGTQSTGDVVDASEQSSGTVITGTGEAGASVSVEIDGHTQTTTVADDGSWSVTFDSSQIATGEYDTNINITTTDSFGNSNSYSETLVVDTVAPAIGLNTVEGDDIINEAEASDGVTLTGTGEAGASISVLFQGVTQTTTVASDGSWSVSYSASQIASGTYDSTVEITSTDAVGNSSTSSHTIQVDTETSVSIDSGMAGGDDIVSAAEAQAGVTLTGNAEAGATVVVEIEGVTRTVTAASDGTWEATFEAGSLTGGEYDTTVNVTSTDLAGNTDTASSDLRIDTVAGTVALTDVGPVNEDVVDNTINAVEREDGVEVTGTATPGMTVTVGLGAASTSVVADSSGNWSTVFAKADIPEGTDTLDVTASITDSVGNTASVSDTIELDTELDPLTINTVAGDDIINANERDAGVTLSGTVEPGSTVEVYMGSSGPHSATVDSSGNWTVTLDRADVDTGTTDADIEVHATDAAGNTALVEHTVEIDTEVSPFTVEENQTANDIINADELEDGVTLQGTVEPGSTVVVTIDSVAKSASVDASGNWSVVFDSDELGGEGEYEVEATIVATDVNGNVETLTENFEVDTVFQAPVIDQITNDAGTGNVTAIAIEGTDGVENTNTVSALEGDGTATTLTDTETEIGGATWHFFDSPVSDGTNLVVTNTDDLSNTSSTLVILEDNATESGTLDHAALGGFNIDELDLATTSNVSLELDEATIKALSENSDTLTIHSGDSDDTVTVTGATKTGTRSVDGEDYDVYTVGSDGATLVIDQDINVII